MKKYIYYFLLLSITISFSTIACDKDDDDDKPTVISAVGEVQPAIDEFRNLLGANNGNASGSQTSGRREINWDGVPDSLSAPYNFPG